MKSLASVIALLAVAEVTSATDTAPFSATSPECRVEIPATSLATAGVPQCSVHHEGIASVACGTAQCDVTVDGLAEGSATPPGNLAVYMTLSSPGVEPVYICSESTLGAPPASTVACSGSEVLRDLPLPPESCVPLRILTAEDVDQLIFTGFYSLAETNLTLCRDAQGTPSLL